MNRRLLIAAMLALVIASPVAALATASVRDPGLVWKDCGDGLRCADLVVPVDWAATGGPTTSIHLAKLPAKNPRRSLGPLVVNFGGPAPSTHLLRPPDAPDYPPELPDLLDELTEHFDVIAMDPRGLAEPATGRLITCGEPGAPITGLVTMRTKSDWDAHAAQNAAHEASCQKAAGALWYGLTSWQVAHDLDAVRAALGQRTLRYAGNSYGTTYGQAYLSLFPERVGRMYFDGTPDHTYPDMEQWLRDVALVQERHLLRFRDWCADRTDCALHGRNAARVFDRVLERARRAPLPASGDRTVDAGAVLEASVTGLNPALWPEFATALRDADRGDAAGFLDDLAPDEGSTTLSGASLCNDYMPDPPTYRQFRGIEARLKKIAPRVGWIAARWQLGRCVGRTGGPSWAPRPLPTGRQLPPLLFAVGELDNNTNYRGQLHVARQLPSARVLRHGDGHASWAGNSCLRRHVTRYLTTGALPAKGARCPAERIHRVGR